MPSEKKGTGNTNHAQTGKNPAPSIDAFVKHLQAASEVVRAWPAWKQHVLGAVTDKPTIKSVSNPPHQ